MVRATSKKSRNVRRTQKTRRHGKGHGTVFTIPQLRKGMEHISSFSEKVVASTMAHAEKVKKFQVEWRATFGKALDAHVASNYIKHLETMMKSGKGRGRGRTHKKRNMRGGMAPIDSITRPGTDIPYGAYPEYVRSGFWNPEPALAASCGIQQGVVPYPGTGSNQVGGSILTDMLGSYLPFSNEFAAASFRPYTAQNPPTFQQDLGTTWKGQPTGPGSESWQQAWQYCSPPGGFGPIPMTTALERTLSTDIRIP